MRTLCGLCVLAKPLGVLSRHPCRIPKPPSPWEGAILMGLPPLDQARMLAVSHTKPLHDAVVQMADDLYGGYAPATPFSENTKVYLQTETPFRGCFSLFLQSATGCENQPVFFCTFSLFHRQNVLL